MTAIDWLVGSFALKIYKQCPLNRLVIIVVDSVVVCVCRWLSVCVGFGVLNGAVYSAII